MWLLLLRLGAGASATVKGLQMANWCSIALPAGASVGEWTNYSQLTGAYSSYFTPAHFRNSANTATSSAPFYFNADAYNIVCSSFPSAGGGADPLVSQAAAISALQAADVGLQSQITAITPWSAASDAGGYMTSELHVEYFGAVVAFLVVIWLADRVRRFFWREGGDHV
jgi:hypothetical protein